MIKKGETISCEMCEKEIYRARVDIPYGATMKSDCLEFMDGTPLPYQAKMACPECWILYRSISTETRKTILIYQEENDVDGQGGSN